MTSRTLPFTKGHGTENDFVLVPDPDGALSLGPGEVAWIADRRAGVGGDGVIRVVPTAAADEPAVREQAGEAAWFMDYRNADGSVAEMCGNGTRVFAAYLRREGLETGSDFAIATRAGTKRVQVRTTEAGEAAYAVDLGPWRLSVPEVAAADGSDALVKVDDHEAVPGLSLDLGNPHTVVMLPAGRELAELDLTRAPLVQPVPPEGTNVEFVQLLGPGHVRMRVHERGVGETRSCGTGAAAAALATRWWAGARGTGDVWRVDVPGGTVWVRPLPGDRVELSGPARLVADGTLVLPDHA
ncbi:diaminopimelate epimerase [Arsenicicoccus sp. oral taxon 190]|uniref:diaminopimelate epimerase n=1 Tax=Arsenicicoccus sp. oral taxon 190 TaxID=1658671 RepID=UPI00067A237F|nr:diaminopimelate epimerase [Arsenicicoccus sp. oral taxon 190]AKT52189.1 diaminopimelate epimerase [Arsenicicoccus sp. oral taxon 190]